MRTSAATVAGTREQIHWRLGESVTLRGRTRPTRLTRPAHLGSARP
ncbi:hypothetical protein [Nocardia niigatensis]|nr:hypothetical protein [Nocardia niigatensis]